MGEKEYIERGALIAAYDADHVGSPWRARELVANAPSADVRPVVFCKDCMHSVQGENSLECKKHRYVWNNTNRWVNDEDFCCWGAMMEES